MMTVIRSVLGAWIRIRVRAGRYWGWKIWLRGRVRVRFRSYGSRFMLRMAYN